MQDQIEETIRNKVIVSVEKGSASNINGGMRSALENNEGSQSNIQNFIRDNGCCMSNNDENFDGENGAGSINNDDTVEDIEFDRSGDDQNMSNTDIQFDFDVSEDSTGTKYFIPVVDDELKPKVKTRFSSLKEAEAMYRAYAKKAGFGVRLNARKLNKFGHISTRWLVCRREGIPKTKDFDSLDTTSGSRTYRNSNFKRCGCNARIKLHLSKDRTSYVISEFVEQHNHLLFDANDSRFSKSNREMKYSDYKHVLNSANYKLGATKAHRIKAALNGGFEHTRCTDVDFKNFKRDVVAFVGNKDAKMLINKLTNRRSVVPEYFFEYKVCGSELNAIFWADEVARMNYKEFGDVISFDGTYRTNRHAMIFVPFLAVDNHYSSVVVGSALISAEKIENFTWVLQAFMKCHEKQPSFVITDQCAAMKQAIPLVFTEAKHRFCMWHIMNKVPSKVSSALNRDPDFSSDINNLVWNVKIGPDEFETNWMNMIQKYNLVGDPWFDEMYDIRHTWIPAYFKETHMSGLMKTTSRSESSNAYINIYESYWFDLVEFLSNYDTAIEKQRYNQAVHENVTRSTRPKFVTPLRIERHASNIYTRTIFFHIQKEIRKAVWSCRIETVDGPTENKMYLISQKSKKSIDSIKHMVSRNYHDDTVECDCNLFVRFGYLCRHAMKVLINDEVESIPDKYVLRRWSRQLVTIQLQSARVRYGEVDAEKEKCIIDIHSKIDDIISIARNDKSILARLGDILDNFKGSIEKEVPYEDPKQQMIDAITEHLGVPVPDEVDILPPSGIRNKGCGTGKRQTSVHEKIQNKSKKTKRKCATCGQRTGHDSRNCPTNN